MKKIRKIKLLGDRQPRGPIHALKLSQYLPIKTARNMFNTPWQEVRIMEVAGFEVQGHTMAEQIKSIRKVRLQREVLENPEMARELVKVESTGTYNARGDLVQAVSTDLGDA
ncbi:hypothetical protein ACR42D_16455 [Desulfovibrio caledoniensis]